MKSSNRIESNHRYLFCIRKTNRNNNYALISFVWLSSQIQSKKNRLKVHYWPTPNYYAQLKCLSYLKNLFGLYFNFPIKFRYLFYRPFFRFLFLLFFCLVTCLQIVILFEISYKSPDDEAGNFEPRHLIDPIQRQHHELHHTHSDSLDDDQQKLLDIEQNIANLERNMNRGKLICPVI